MKNIEKHLEVYIEMQRIFDNLPKDTEIIVEGKRDKIYLTKYFKIRGDIIIKTLREFHLRKYIPSRYILILTDFDKQGEEYYNTISKIFSTFGESKILYKERKKIRDTTRIYGDEIHSIIKALIKKIRLYSYESLKNMV